MWVHRREHFRNASDRPERSKVAATVLFIPDITRDAPIRVSKPAHGGTAVSEVLASGGCIPHPCFDRLRGKRASDEMLDLFEWVGA